MRRDGRNAQDLRGNVDRSECLAGVRRKGQESGNNRNGEMFFRGLSCSAEKAGEEVEQLLLPHGQSALGEPRLLVGVVSRREAERANLQKRYTSPS